FVVACRHCNFSKHDRLLSEWGRQLLPEPYQLPTGSDRQNYQLPTGSDRQNDLVSRARAGGEGSGYGEDLGSDPGGGGEGEGCLEERIFPVRPPRPFAHVGAATPAFLSVFDRYPRKDAKAEAAQSFQELAADYPGGEDALAAAIL